MAAGLIEGYLTEDLIYTHSKNIYGEKQPSKHVRAFCPSHSQIQRILDENEAWEKEESAVGDKEYWNHRRYLDLQVDGVYEGYLRANRGRPERVVPISSFHSLVLDEVADPVRELRRRCWRLERTASQRHGELARQVRDRPSGPLLGADPHDGC